MAGRQSIPSPVYLDHASTTPLRPEVEAAMAAAGREGFANPSSQHTAGRRARALLEDARERILAALGHTPGPRRARLVFTSGATEANRLAILGLGHAGAVATSARDHSSLRAAAARLSRDHGWSLTDVALSGDGGLDVDAVVAWLDHTGSAANRLLCTTPVCGQTGVIDPLGSIGEHLRRQGRCLLHADATQAVAYTGVDFAGLGCATMTLTAHKFGGPRGIGALVIRDDVTIEPLQPGPQETGLRGGTEAVALAAGFAVAVELAVAERAAEARRLAAIRDRFEAAVLAVVRTHDGTATVIGGRGQRSPHVSTIGFHGRDRQAIVMAADLAGLCCATGTACSSGSGEPAAALVAMGLPAEIARGAVRFSFGRTTTDDDIARAARILGTLLEKT